MFDEILNEVHVLRQRPVDFVCGLSLPFSLAFARVTISEVAPAVLALDSCGQSEATESMATLLRTSSYRKFPVEWPFLSRRPLFDRRPCTRLPSGRTDSCVAELD